jgi:hypothetical protein
LKALLNLHLNGLNDLRLHEEVDLLLRWMDVDIHRMRKEEEGEVEERVCVLRQEGVVNGFDGLLQRGAVNKAVVDEEDESPFGFVKRRRRDESFGRQAEALQAIGMW